MFRLWAGALPRHGGSGCGNCRGRYQCRVDSVGSAMGNPEEAAGGQPVLRVALGDFPLFDGSTSLESFLQQCERLSHLGGIPAPQLPSIVAARCRGLAQRVVEGAAAGADVTAVLRHAFSATSTASAATQLSSLKKGSMSALEFSLEVKRMIRLACPEFFDATGKVKNCCGTSYQAALYRHLLVGLSDQEKLLLSRQGVTTFEAAVDELLREEALNGGHVDTERSRVHWAECEAVDMADGRPEPPRSREDRRRSADRVPTPRRYDIAPERDGGGGFRRRSSSSPPGGGGWSPGRSSGRRPSGGGWRNREDSRPRGGPRGRSPRGGGGRAPSPRSSPGRQAGSRSSAGGRDSSSSEEEPYQRRRPPQCYACRGFGHLKRDCPNVRPGGRW